MPTSYQPTSRLAYDSVKPVLGDHQRIVLGLIKQHESITNLEIARALGWEINRVTPRVHEIRKAGYVREWGKRYDKVSGRLAIAWMEAKDTLF